MTALIKMLPSAVTEMIRGSIASGTVVKLGYVMIKIDGSAAVPVELSSSIEN